jgi:nucleoid-associated protein YgaU
VISDEREHSRKENAVKVALASIAIVMLMVATGCQNGKKSATNPSVMPLNQPPAPVAYAPPSPVPAPPAQPVVYDAPPTPAVTAAPAAPEAAAAPAAGGKKYKVQKGDTLYSLAKSHYGSGKQFTKIVAANPGLSPETLKAGQTITIP